MKLPGRSHIAIILAVIYSLIIMSPLTDRVIHSKTVIHALTGECTGDCATCNCSAESMATRTCCCIKKQMQSHAHGDEFDNTPDCCKKAYDGKQVVIASCGCPCGNGEQAALSVSEASELLPCYFTAQFNIPGTDTRFPLFTGHLISFQTKPPVPPPKVSVIS